MIPNFFKECRNPSDLYAALQPLFLLSFIIGLIPIRISGPPALRKVEVTFYGILNTLIIASLFSACFIIAIINKESLVGYLSNSDVTSLGDVIYKLGGYFGLIIIFMSCIFQRNLLIKLINTLADVDVRLMNLGVSINYRVAIRFSYVTIIITTLINITYMLCTYLLITSVGFYPSYSLFASSFLPHFIQSIMVVMFMFIAYKIKQRFLTINQVLQNLTHKLSNKCRALKKRQSTWRFETFSIHPIVSKPASEVIDESMQVHSLLSDAATTANNYFTYQLLTIISMAFIMILFDTYYILEIIFQPIDNQIQYSTTELIILCVCEMSLYIFAVLAIVEVSSKATNQCKDTALCVHNLLNSTKDESLRERLSFFSLQLIHHSIHFSAAGLFKIDRTLYFIMSGAATTYLIILMQYSKEPTNTPELFNITQDNP